MNLDSASPKRYSLVVVPRTANTAPELTDALRSAGVAARRLDDDRVEIAGTTFTVMPAKVVRENDAALLAIIRERKKWSPTIIVADRISKSARAELSAAGLAWLDRRGHLWVRADGLFVNAEVPSSAVPPGRRVLDVFSGAGLDVALALLTSPDEPRGVHELARLIDRSASRVSEILSALRSQGLAGEDNRPIVPELFWAIAEEWKPPWTPMPAAPPPEPPERYRLSGTLGALALGVPLATGAEGTWPRLYVADHVDLATVRNAYGASSGWTGSEVAVCPSKFGFTWGSTTFRDGYPVANHLVVALDLAQDQARGREVLEGWDPEGFSRVW